MKKVIAISAILFVAIAMMSCSDNSKTISKCEAKKAMPANLLPEVIIFASETDEVLESEMIILPPGIYANKISSEGNFNAHHPECLPGEKFFCNILGGICYNDDGTTEMITDKAIIAEDILSKFKSLSNPGKRLGNIAYDNAGICIPNARPVFVPILVSGE